MEMQKLSAQTENLQATDVTDPLSQTGYLQIKIAFSNKFLDYLVSSVKMVSLIEEKRNYSAKTGQVNEDHQIIIRISSCHSLRSMDSSSPIHTAG
jgi:hypothetical protein